ncbi:MAG: CoA pyrophosphatase [Acidimicrobiia bacterium]
MTDESAPPSWAGLHDQPTMTVDEVMRRASSFRPTIRRSFGFDMPDARPSATLVPIIDVDGEAAVVVTKRAGTMLHHRDDWVFPGGRMHEGVDATLADTAAREADEELGVPRERLEIVAELDSYGPINTGYLVHVFAGVVRGHVELVPDPREVSDVAVVALSTLVSPTSYDMRYPFPSDHQPGPLATNVPGRLRPIAKPGATVECFFLRPGEILWGMQATILANLLDLLAAPATR